MQFVMVLSHVNLISHNNCWLLQTHHLLHYLFGCFVHSIIIIIIIIIIIVVVVVVVVDVVIGAENKINYP